MPYEPPFNRTDRIDELSMEIAELVGMVSPDADLIKSPRLHRELRIRTIHSSLMIEGNALNESAVTAVLDGTRVLGDEKDILEVKNAEKAYGMLPELDPNSIDDMLKVHGVMMKDLVPEAGRLRTGNVGVFDGDKLIHAGTPANYVSEVMQDLFVWLKETTVHPLIASSIFHYEFEFIHPFADGNGRTGRLWQTLLLSKWRPLLAWVPVESTIRERQSGYYAALEESEMAASSDKFVEFMLEAIRDALRPFAVPDGEHDVEAERALAFFAESPDGNMSELAEFLGVSKRTAERVVKRLKDQGVLSREGSSRSGRWVIAR